MLTELSLSCDRNLVVQIPTAENALSVSTDVGGTVNKYEYTVSKQEPRFPVLSNKQIVIGQEWKKSSYNLQHGCRSTVTVSV